jgi:DNA-binding CsgD family transcriptional regulator
MQHGEPDSDEDGCIEALYDCLVNPAGLPAAVQRLRSFFGATKATFFVADANARIRSFASDGHDPSTVRLFLERYEMHDPTRATVLASAPGQWLTNDELLHPVRTPNAEYVNDFAIPAGMRWQRGGKVMQGANGSAYLAFHRPADATPFDDADTSSKLNRLFPHLRRVSRLMLEMRSSLSAVAAAERSVNLLAAGVCAVDINAIVSFTNPAAVSLCDKRAWFHISCGRLRFVANRASDAFERALVLACTTPRTASAFSIEFAEKGRLLVRVLPMGDLHAMTFVEGKPRALVFMSGTQQMLGQREIRQLFGLSIAESELVALLARGLTPNRCAQERGVRISTIRSQLSSVFLKTGTQTQAELMRAILALPTVL